MKLAVRTGGLLGKYLPEGSARNSAEIDLPEGITAAALIERLGMPHNQDALKLLQNFQDHPEMPDGLRAAAKRLTKRVTPDHRLPHPQDPLEDARAIIAGLLNSPATP